MPGTHEPRRHRMMHEWQMDEQKEGRGGYKSTALLPLPGAGSTKPHTGQLCCKNSNEGTPDKKYTEK